MRCARIKTQMQAGQKANDKKAEAGPMQKMQMEDEVEEALVQVPMNTRKTEDEEDALVQKG